MDNKAADALSMRLCTLETLNAEVIDFDCLIQDYPTCRDFYFIDSGATHFSGRFNHCWWVPIRGQPITHSQHFFTGSFDLGNACGGVAGHFGRDKTIVLVEGRFYWPVSSVMLWELCQVAKYVKLLMVGNRTHNFTHCCLFPLHLGSISVWISF